MSNRLQEFLHQWETETRGTLELLRALPPDSYDFRPDGSGRSIGELAWHLAEADAYVTYGIERRSFAFEQKPAHIQRPRTIAGLALQFEMVHADAVARVARLSEADLDRSIASVDGNSCTVRDLLWRKLLLHAIHHRGQLTLLCRLAGGVPPGLYGRTREEGPHDGVTALDVLRSERPTQTSAQSPAPAFSTRLSSKRESLNNAT